MSRVLRSSHLAALQRWVPQPMAEVIVTEPEPESDTPDPAEVLLAKAIREAEEIRAAAEADAEGIRQQAHDEGFARGYEEAEYACREKADALTALTDEINGEREAFFDRVEPDLVRLSVTIAEKVLAQQITLKPEVVVDITRRCMKRIRDREVLQIRINPDDLPLLNEARGSLLAEVDGVREIALFEDRRVDNGGVVIETAGGSLDARISSQMDVIAKALAQASEGAHGDATD